jgi:hypothetical protein
LSGHDASTQRNLRLYLAPLVRVPRRSGHTGDTRSRGPTPADRAIARTGTRRLALEQDSNESAAGSATPPRWQCWVWNQHCFRARASPISLSWPDSCSLNSRALHPWPARDSSQGACVPVHPPTATRSGPRHLLHLCWRLRPYQGEQGGSAVELDSAKSSTFAFFSGAGSSSAMLKISGGTAATHSSSYTA